MYQQYDELRQQMKKNNIYSFCEGVNNSGPQFLPTCKLDKDRGENDIIWKLGKYDQRNPSWCDRILYQTYKNDTYNITCTKYDRFQSGQVMSDSDHAGVIGIYSLSN